MNGHGKLVAEGEEQPGLLEAGFRSADPDERARDFASQLGETRRAADDRRVAEAHPGPRRIVVDDDSDLPAE